MKSKKNTHGDKRISRRQMLARLSQGALAAALAPHVWAQSKPSAVSAPAVSRPNILLISVDTLRADHVSHLGYSRQTTVCIDQLANTGVTFTRTYAASAWTGASHASLLTGFYPPVHLLDDQEKKLPPHFPTLAQSLRDLGYYTKAIVSGPMVDARLGFAQGFDDYDDRSYKNAVDFQALRDQVNFPGITEQSAREEILLYKIQTAEVARKSAEEFITKPPREPWFLFLHFWDVHADYRPPAMFDVFGTGYSGAMDGNIKNTTVNAQMPPKDLQRFISLYDGEVRWTDHQIGTLLKKMKDLKIEENTCVALCSDHGEEFFEYGNKGHGHHLHNLLVNVPLVFRWPRKVIQGLRTEVPVSLVDVAPTLIEVAGGRPSPLLQGSSLLPVLAGKSESRLATVQYGSLFFRGKSQISRIEYPFKLIQEAKTGELFLFNMAEDPAEKLNLSAQMPEAAKNYADDLKRWWEECQAIRGQLPIPAQSVGKNDQASSATLQNS